MRHGRKYETSIYHPQVKQLLECRLLECKCLECYFWYSNRINTKPFFRTVFYDRVSLPLNKFLMNDSEYSALTENGLFTSLDIYWSTHHKMIPHKGVKMWMVEGGCITRKTFHYYIKSSLFGFSLGYRQSFNWEKPRVA